ncbi:hypothetical protein GOC91_21405 [Sinorhizobium medicae]|uniref:Uncharacterized protein n=2 Tax=Sinorhizobium medicae TaxID=110321 RepID=A0A6G1WM17_9HYPH|nr:conserved hypothetical protein [Sinorhizobium medicae WSM419]MDX0406857.1 hypothetical protein [Sinorhizobium medicae]MDX0412405.1 hypothetical protein [Sinorhizobium medicae]MDX0418567.1 hypothetical protein [Sinorhizobium medicae]MDX0424827.1 hypothetical protein [Sinorhizobium medicae]
MITDEQIRRMGVLLDPQRVEEFAMRRGLHHHPTVDLIVFIAAVGLVSAIMIASLFFG